MSRTELGIFMEERLGERLQLTDQVWTPENRVLFTKIRIDFLHTLQTPTISREAAEAFSHGQNWVSVSGQSHDWLFRVYPEGADEFKERNGMLVVGHERSGERRIPAGITLMVPFTENKLYWWRFGIDSGQDPLIGQEALEAVAEFQSVMIEDLNLAEFFGN